MNAQHSARNINIGEARDTLRKGLSGMDVSAPKLTGKGGGPGPLWAHRVEEVSQTGFSIRTGLREAVDSVMSLIHAEVTR